MPHFRFSPITASLLVTAFLLQSGCRTEPEPAARFEPNLVHAMKYEIKEGVPTDQASKDVTWVITEMFGTPDDPKLPELITADDDLAELLDTDRLHKASGPFADGRGLYRKHCADCHGVTGNGRGKTAAILNPYPRDYRMGVFKFKSTKRSAKPTRDDLMRLIANGIAGTAMKKIPELSDEDVLALTEYVIYLSIRGELERSLIDDAVLELDLEAGDRVFDYQLSTWIKKTAADRNRNGKNPEDHQHAEYEIDQLKIDGEAIDEDLLEDFREFKETANLLTANQTLIKELDDMKKLVSAYMQMARPLAASDESDDDDEEEEPPTFADNAEKLIEDYEMCEESWEIAEVYLAEIAEAWLLADDDVMEVPEPPSEIPLPKSHAEFVQMSEGDQAESLAESVRRGQSLFVGKIASCSKCHGEKGLGNGTTNDYDDWTKDWVVRAGLKPEDRESLIPLMARGALPPVNAAPRNFAEGIFRGGEKPEDLYRRIMGGIAGSPMPAATFVEGQFEQDDVWHIINFIRSLKAVPTEPTKPAKAATPQT